MARTDTIGTVYLLHFSEKFHHCQHYIGWTKYLDARIKHHKAGTGSRLVRAVVGAGITVTLVRTWANTDRKFERKLKNRKKARCLCPICRKEKPRNTGAN